MRKDRRQVMRSSRKFDRLGEKKEIEKKKKKIKRKVMKRKSFIME